MTTVEINLNGTGTKGVVKVDGLDVANLVSAFTVSGAAGATVTTVTLTIPVRNNIHFAGEARVDFDPTTTGLLRRLGWTPPSDVVLPRPESAVEHAPVGSPPSG